MSQIKKNKITFIIPSINRPTLLRTVQSLFFQTNPNWECIIIYDGIDGQQFNDERIKTIKIEKTGRVGPHTGLSGMVRNKGMEICDTEWIGFIDDDDTIHPNYVETLLTKYKNYDFVVWRMKYTFGRVLPPENHDELIFGAVGISFCYKNIFENLFFDNNRDGEDFDLLMKLKSLSNNYIVTPEIYYNVRH